MITVKLMGGLGNQMFQYALGRALSIDLNDTLQLDLSFYDRIHKNTTSRPYGLECFSIQPNVVHRSILSTYIYRIFGRVSNKYPKFLPQVINEPNLKYNPFLFDGANGNLYLDGFWQCEKYFKHHEDVIRSDFQVSIPQDEMNIQWSKMIREKQSVCLHVRRGDYITNAGANKVHGVLQGSDGLSYYRRAIEYIASIAKEPVFFVFSDDLPWVKENLKIPYETHYMDQNDSEKNYEDLRLMMQCKHFIIANSSFSWWGAWLSDYAEKIVVCPNKWFADPVMKTDIICDGWVRL